MSRKREPEALVIDWGEGVLVKHTHDGELADRLARAALVRELHDGHEDEAREHGVRLGERKTIWCRLVPALPNTWAAAEGYSWSYMHCDGPARGAFRAVEYRR